jgi:hypothetical protein
MGWPFGSILGAVGLYNALSGLPDGKNLLNFQVLTANLRRRFFIAVLVAIAQLGVIAGELLADTPLTPYRLTVENTDKFLFSGGKFYTNPLGLAKENTASTAQFANKPFSAQIERAAHRAAIDPALVHAVIQIESGYDPKARSPKGALGLMQVMPLTALRYGVPNADREPEANLKAGTRYLSDLLKLFDNRLDLALAAYNAGENAVIRNRMRVPPYRETEQYVPAVLAKYREWQELRPTPIGPHRIEYLPGTTLEPANWPGLRP